MKVSECKKLHKPYLRGFCNKLVKYHWPSLLHEKICEKPSNRCKSRWKRQAKREQDFYTSTCPHGSRHLARPTPGSFMAQVHHGQFVPGTYQTGHADKLSDSVVSPNYNSLCSFLKAYIIK